MTNIFNNEDLEKFNWVKQKIKNYNDNVDKVTSYYQKVYGFEYNSERRDIAFWNNEGDAFKHAYMQADLSFKFGDTVAKVPGYYHEIDNLLKRNPWNETNMDLWNNKVGQQIGQEVAREIRMKHKLGEKKNQQEIDDAIAEKIMQRMRNGELITNPSDPRQFKDFENGGYPSKNWQNYLNQPKDFSKLQPAKLDELKQPTVQGVSGANSLLDQSQLIVHQPIAQFTPNKLAWMAQLGNILSTTANVISSGVKIASGIGGVDSGVSTGGVGSGTPSGTGYSGTLPKLGTTWDCYGTIVPSSHHTGGKITPQPISNRSSRGKDEVLAILRAGETVRTEAQEQELQQEKYAEFLEAVRPYLEERENKPKTIAEAYDPENKIPCLLNKTTQDEELIISIIAQAWKSNRLGFRNVLRYE